MGKKPTYEELEQRVKELEREVSECSRAAEELRQEQRVFIGGPVVVFTWLATENWPAAYVSPNVTQFGYQADDFVSGRLPYTDIIHREDLDKVQSEVKEYSESGVPFYEQEYRIIQADGGTRWVYDFTLVRRNDQSEITHYDGYVLDITERKRAEEELSKNERFLKNVFDAIQDGISVRDRDLNIIQVNRWMETKYASHMPLIGKKCYAVFQQRKSSCPWCPAIPAMETGELQRQVVPYPSAEKPAGWFELTAFSLKDAEGHITGAIEHVKDITERMRAEEALKDSELQKGAILDAGVDMIMQYDTDLRILWANKTAAVFVNKTPQDLVGHKCHKIFQDLDSPCPGCPCVKVLETGNSENSIMYHADMDAVGESYWHNYAVPIKDESGKVDTIIEIARNVTKQKRAEEALRDSELKFRTLFDSSPQAIALTEFQTGKLVDVNFKFCELTKYAAEEIIGRTTTECEFYSEADRARFIDEFQGTGEVLGLEMDFKAKDGSTLNMQMFSRVIQIGNEELLLTTFLDMTKQKRLEVQLQQAQKMEAIGTLSGGIAHDFNNLLTGIQGNVSLLFLDIDTTHPHYERLKSIEKQVQSGARLTSHLLGYARKGKYEVKPVDINHLVRETSESFRRTRKDISIHLQLSEELFAIEADYGQIEQVLWNLFINAGDAMPGDGELILKTDNVTHEDMQGKVYDPKPGKYVLLTVADTGIGMDKQTIDRIFDPFFTTKEMGRGTGLGLASAYGIIKAHAGYIDVKSEKGVGTNFSIYLSATEKKVYKVVKAAQEVIEGTETVLLIDDEDVILEVGKHLLEAMGYRVLTARDGKEAVEIYEKNSDKIDLVILDMVMPRMGGGEAYDKMKEVNPKVKVLLSSGYSIDSQAKEILARGCDAYIQKPFGIRELSQKIREVLQKK